MEDPPLSAVAALLCDTLSGLLLCVRFVESTALDWLLNDEVDAGRSPLLIVVVVAYCFVE